MDALHTNRISWIRAEAAVLAGCRISMKFRFTVHLWILQAALGFDFSSSISLLLLASADLVSRTTWTLCPGVVSVLLELLDAAR